MGARDLASSAPRELRIAVDTLAGGARVIDAGVDAVGGLAAGRALAELCMGGLGHVDFTPLTIGGETWPGVQVWTDHPAESCMASQYAGWAINPDGFFAMGSGPLRAKARVERELFAKLGYAEDADPRRAGARRPHAADATTSPRGWRARRASRRRA